MLETTQNSILSEQPVQTAGEKLFPTPLALRERMQICGITSKVTAFLIDARVTGVDKNLPLPKRQLLEA